MLYIFVFCLFMALPELMHAKIMCQLSDGRTLPLSGKSIEDNQEHIDDFVKCIAHNIKRDLGDAPDALGSYAKTNNDLQPLVPALVEGIDSSLQLRTFNVLYLLLYHGNFLSEEDKKKIGAKAEKRWPVKTIGNMAELLNTRVRATPNVIALTNAFQDELRNTQTGIHLIQNVDAVSSCTQLHEIAFSKSYTQEVKKTLLKALEKEKEEVAAGNYVFWNGGAYEFDFCRDVYAELYKINHSKESIDKDFKFLRFGDGSKTVWRLPFFGSDVLYMNAALFGNAGNLGCSSLHYMVESPFWSEKKIDQFSSKYFLSLFDLQHLYPKYESELTQLEQLHVAANPSKVGTLLMISLDKKYIGMVYSTDAFGFKRKIDVGAGVETSDAQTIIAALKAGTLHDSDSIQYAVPLAKRSMPTPGQKIYSFNTVDPIKYTEYQEFRKDLFERMRKDIETYKSEQVDPTHWH